MKNKYERLSKEEKKLACDNFKNSEDNKNRVYEKLTRLKVIGLFGFIYGVLSMLFDIFIIDSKTWIYFYDGVVIVISFVAFYKSSEMRSRLVNSYLINKDKKKK